MRKFKLFLSLIKESIKLSPSNNAVMLFSTVLNGASRVIEVFFPAFIVKCIIAKTSFMTLLVSISVFAFIVGIMGIGQKAASLYSTATGYRAANIATLNIQGHAMQMPFDEWEADSSYEEITRAVNASWVFQTITDAVFDKLLVAIVLLLPSLYVLFRVHVIVLIVLLALIFIEYKIEEKFDERRFDLEDEAAELQKKADYDEKVLKGLEFAKEVRLYNMKNGLVHRFQDDKKDEQELLCKANGILTRFSIISIVFASVEAVIVYLFAIWQYNLGKMDIADFLALVGAIILLVESVKQIAYAINWIKDIVNYYSHYHDFMMDERITTERKETDNSDCINASQDADTPVLRMDSVSYRYDDSENEALHGIDLTIAPKEKIAIVGENGAGKSTLAKVLLGIYEKYEGHLFLYGKDGKSVTREEYYSKVKAVFQDYFLHAFSLRDNIVLNRKRDDSRIDYCLDLLDLRKAIEKHPDGLDTWYSKELSENGAELSGGESQKLATIRGIYEEADLLVLDEATAAFDPLAEKQYYDALFKEIQGAVVFITHRMATAKKADRIVVMDQGRIVEEGSFESLMRCQGAFYRLYSEQAKLYEENPV